MKRALAPLLALLLLAGCAAPREEPSSDDYTLYYAARPGEGAGGDAVRATTVRVEDSASLTTEQLAEALVTRLLEPPGDDALRSPFPSGAALHKIAVAGGRANVDLSEQYARLSGVDLSIADCCVTLTLTQLDGVYAVRITANGRELPYRKAQLMTAADALLSSGEDVIRPIDVSLYFLDTRTGGLRAQAQTLALYEGQTRVSAVLGALTRGPEGDDALAALLPEGFNVLSSRIEDGTCYVNLSARAPLPEDDGLRALAVESLARSLLSLSGVEEVQFLVDGEAAPELTVTALAPEEPSET